MASEKEVVAVSSPAGKRLLRSSTRSEQPRETVVPAVTSDFDNSAGRSISTDRQNSEDSQSDSGEERIVPEKLPPRLFATDRYPLNGRINSYSKPEYLLQIVDILHGSLEFEWLKKSRFGRLFQLPVRKCALSGKLVHQMLCRSLVTEKKNEIWFVFGGHPIRFSLREFGIVTGLNCGPFPPAMVTSRMREVPEGGTWYYNTLIGPKSSYTIQEVVDILKRDKRLPKSQRMDGGRRLRLCLLVIVEGILICNSSNVKASYKVAEMLKDVEEFDKYPWGRKSFKKTLEMVKVGKMVNNVDKLCQKLSQSHTATHGFTLAFQLVFLQAIPLLQNHLPTASDEQTFTDRSILNLTLLKTFHNSNILETEMHREVVVDSVLYTEDEEDVQDYSWEDDEEVEDASVDYLYKKCRAGYCFKKGDWHGGKDDLPLITPCLSMNQKLRLSKPATQRKGKQPRVKKGKKTTVNAESVGAGGGDVEYGSYKDIFNEVDRRNGENLRKVESLLSTERNCLRDEIVDEVLQALREKGVFERVNITHSELLAAMASPKFPTPASTSTKVPRTVPGKGGLREYGVDDSMLEDLREHVGDPTTGGKGSSKVGDTFEERDDGLIQKVQPEGEDGCENVDLFEKVNSGKVAVSSDDESAEQSSEEKRDAEEDYYNSGHVEGVFEQVVGVGEGSQKVAEGGEGNKVIDGDNYCDAGGDETDGEEKNGEGKDKGEDKAQDQDEDKGGDLKEQDGGEETDDEREELEDREGEEKVGEGVDDEEEKQEVPELKDDGVHRGDDEEEHKDDGEESDDLASGDDGPEGNKGGDLIEQEGGDLKEKEGGGQDMEGVVEEESREVRPESEDIGGDSGEKTSDGQVKHMCVESEGNVEGKDVQEGKKRKLEEDTVAVVHSKRPRRKPSRFGQCSSQTKKTPVEAVSTYSPFPVVKAALRKRFLQKLQSHGEENYVIDGHTVKNTFFEAIYTPQNWVASPEMEAMLSVLWMRLGDSFLESRIAILDTWFAATLSKDYAQYTKSKGKTGIQWNSLIKNYVRGRVSNRYGKMSWCIDVDTVYFPMNWGDRHWVGIAVDLKAAEISILDPFFPQTDARKLPRLMKPLVVLLPKIIAELVNEESANYALPRSFTFARLPDVYQNERSGDCGPLTVKYMELHAKGLPLTGLTEKMVDELRMTYAVNVYEEFVVSLTY